MLGAALWSRPCGKALKMLGSGQQTARNQGPHSNGLLVPQETKWCLQLSELVRGIFPHLKFQMRLQPCLTPYMWEIQKQRTHFKFAQSLTHGNFGAKMCFIICFCVCGTSSPQINNTDTITLTWTTSVLLASPLALSKAFSSIQQQLFV